MKNVKITLTSMLALLVSLAFFTSCNEEENLQPSEQPLSDEVLSQFSQLGFDISDIGTTAGMEFLDPAQEGGYLLEGDLVIPKLSLQNMLLGTKIESDNPKLEQYRTNNLVSQNRTIRVIGYTGNDQFGLDSKTRTALQWAVNNYNRINISLNFTLTFGTNFNAFDMVVYRVSGGGGGSAGFPSGGAPNKFIRINSGTSDFSTNVVEHVITHEMGHSVGLRHTDYFNRSISCGSGGNEGSAGVGAILIPGTPSGADLNSIMLACFSSNEDGEFGPEDVEALEFLY